MKKLLFYIGYFLIVCLLASCESSKVNYRPSTHNDLFGKWVSISKYGDAYGKATIELKSDGTCIARDVPRDVIFRNAEEGSPETLISSEGIWRYNAEFNNVGLTFENFTSAYTKSKSQPTTTIMHFQSDGGKELLLVYMGDPDISANIYKFQKNGDP